MFWIGLSVFACISVVFGSPSEDLLKHLMQSYVKELKPDEKVLMTHSITFRDIRSYDEGILTAGVWINMQWTDNRLQWNPENFGQVTNLKVPVNLLWKPDVLLYNNAGSKSGMIHDDIKAIISSEGKVYWIPPMQLTSKCKESGWRKTTVTCTWKFGSWVYNGMELDFVNGTMNVDLSYFSANSYLEITHTDAVKHTVKYACCPEPYTDVTYTLEMAKKQQKRD